MSLITSFVDRIRLTVGDTNPEWYFLEDHVYEWCYYENDSNELKAAIAALEYILNYVSLNPEDETLGQVAAKGMSTSVLERRLADLKQKDALSGKKAAAGAIPMIVHGGRNGWDDVDKIFNWQETI